MNEPTLFEKRLIQISVLLLSFWTVVMAFSFLVVQHSSGFLWSVWLPSAVWAFVFLSYGLKLIVTSIGWVPTRIGLRVYRDTLARVMGALYLGTSLVLIAISVALFVTLGLTL